eukprot:GHUV01041171.1.p1 GENE.GHUV01041171.1~~GHUV01041171.1.p1  ORF type:complete len:158 (-),score=14.20 GHUV01041171.1:18-491(-)
MLNCLVQGVALCMNPASASIACKAGSICTAVVARSPPGRVALLTSSRKLGSSIRCFSTASAGAMSVDITRQNLKDSLPAVREALDKCSFYALDCEMTGLFTDGNKHEYLDDIQARCAALKSSKAQLWAGTATAACHTCSGTRINIPHAAVSSRHVPM